MAPGEKIGIVGDRATSALSNDFSQPVDGSGRKDGGAALHIRRHPNLERNMVTSYEFSSPFNWCDRRCEVCPLHVDCPIFIREAQLRWVHTARGEDPDDPSLVFGDAVSELTRAVALVQEAAREEGINLDEPVQEPPVSLSNERLYRTALGLLRAMSDALRDVVPEDHVEQALGAAMTLATKVGRIRAYSGPDDLVWFDDAVPNLLLIEHLLTTARSALESMRPRVGGADMERVDRADGALRSQLAEHLQTIPSWARVKLAALAAEGRAPSPFCTAATQEPGSIPSSQSDAP